VWPRYAHAGGRDPQRHRAALRAALDQLAAGDRPEVLTWVAAYGHSGTELVTQPDEIWTHRWTDYREREDGSAYGSMPLWAAGQSPSDLSAEFENTPRHRVADGRPRAVSGFRHERASSDASRHVYSRNPMQQSRADAAALGILPDAHSRSVRPFAPTRASAVGTRALP
jgi:hypothetical protein